MKPAVTIYVFLDQTDAEILPYTVLFARKQTDTEGESCNIEMTEAVKNIRFRTNLPPIFKSNAYLSQRHRQQQHERPMEPDRQPISAEAWEDEYFRRMELLMEYRAVLEALDQLQKRERYILLARILEERSFTELAQELQIGYKGAAAIYYRALSRIREKMEEET